MSNTDAYYTAPVGSDAHRAAYADRPVAAICGPIVSGTSADR